MLTNHASLLMQHFLHAVCLGLMVAVFVPTKGGAGEGATRWVHTELRRFPAKEATQGVAVDAEHFYAIGNRVIGQYRKDTGVRVGGWKGGADGPIKHLNAGIVVAGRLYAAHSNFPETPAQSSLEIWDTATMRHVERHRFEDAPGSLTWVVPEGKGWLACFAHYRTTSDPARTQVVRFDAAWRTLARWTFPPELIGRFAGYSSSGGDLGPGGKLFVTGHDARELYVLSRPPTAGGILTWEATIPVSAPGQAFAWDASEPGTLYAIERKTREVIVSRITQVP